MTGRQRCGACLLFHRQGFMGGCATVESRSWPLAPLLAAIPKPEAGAMGRPLVDGRSSYASRLGADRVQLARYETFGIPEPVADRWATRLGLHPVQVWGWEWVDAGLSVVDRQYFDGGWRQAWEHNEALQPCDLPPVAPLDPSPHPSTETHIESLTTQHRRSA